MENRVFKGKTKSDEKKVNVMIDEASQKIVYRKVRSPHEIAALTFEIF